MNSITEKWFGSHFSDLHPKLQLLHSGGGILRGEVDVTYGSGMGGLIGKRLGRKLGLPPVSGRTTLNVVISHTNDKMIWSRQFGSSNKPMVSEFTPYGQYSDGCWSETTRGITLELSVELKQGGWHWVQRAMRINSLTIPALFLPNLKANKAIKNDLYHFEVELFKPALGGLLVRYEGALTEVK